MDEAELDTLVSRLVPEFEYTKLQAIVARGEYLALCSQSCVSRDSLRLAHATWHALEERCSDILGFIDQLAERNAA